MINHKYEVGDRIVYSVGLRKYDVKIREVSTDKRDTYPIKTLGGGSFSLAYLDSQIHVNLIKLVKAKKEKKLYSIF